VIALLLSTLTFAAPPPATPSLPMPGTHQLEQNGTKYVLYMPSVPEGKKAPLVVALHYAGEVTPWYGASMMDQLYVPAFGAAGAIVIAPDCPAADWTETSAQSTVMALIDYAIASLPVDGNRVVLTGFSAGGVGTWNIASRYPDRISAAIPIAGNPQGAAKDIEKVPVFALHATTDTVVPYTPTKDKVDALHTSGHVAKLALVSGPSHYQFAGYIDLLRGTIPWLAEQWKAQAAARAAALANPQPVEAAPAVGGPIELD
jgi:poly(3-hydroxybutyrate) depolymerase